MADTRPAALNPVATARARAAKRGWLPWSHDDWQRWQKAPRMTSPLEVGEERALVLMKTPLAERYDIGIGDRPRRSNFPTSVSL